MIITPQSMSGDAIVKLLPKGWFLTDYDKEANLIEIEDENTWDKFWVDAKELFRRDITIGTELYVLNKDHTISPATVTSYGEEIRRKRSYLLARLDIKKETKVQFDPSLHANTKPKSTTSPTTPHAIHTP